MSAPTGPPVTSDDDITAAARAMGRKGGKARSEKLTSERRKSIASSGGKAGSKARMTKLTAEQRSGIARTAVKARWAKRKKSDES